MIYTREEQITLLQKDSNYLRVKRSATKEIIKLDSLSLELLSNDYKNKEHNLKIVKFIPASGAATRMFSFLFEYLETNILTKDVKLFYDQIKQFAFYDKLKLEHKDFDLLVKNYDKKIIKTLLDDDQLNYDFLPKALIEFHTYKDKVSTPIDEHLYESSISAVKEDLHFTISKQHEEFFNNYISKVDTDILISYSFQKEETNTYCLNENNELFIVDNEPLKRPGGHGALLENLNELDADIIYIKNIDNVVHRDYLKDNITYKNALTSIGLSIQNKIFTTIDKINSNKINTRDLKMILNRDLNVFLDDYSTNNVLKVLKRPLRICGMVKNLGEPGGGPFVVTKNGVTSLQIVEKSEIDLSDEKQLAHIKNATHFNPVDIVCFVKDKDGFKYDLTNYVDYDTFFLSDKSYAGKKIKALEYPGLWNGSMANWNTLFVEVDIATFNPVKSVNDLLKKNHQRKGDKL